MLPQLTTSHSRTHKSEQVRAYEGRWRHWYAAIVDFMISEPGIEQVEIARRLNKHPNTIGAIIGTDNFKTYFAHRREQFMARHDFAITAKTQEVGLQALDLILETMKNKRTAVPLALLDKIADSSFERLGYGPKSPAAVQINNVNHGQQVVQLPAVSEAALLEAREALRKAERGHPRQLEYLPEVRSNTVNGGDFVEEEIVEKEMELAPINLST